MPRAPDWLLGFGFTSRDRGLLRYLNTIKERLRSVSEGFENVRESVESLAQQRASVEKFSKSIEKTRVAQPKKKTPPEALARAEEEAPPREAPIACEMAREIREIPRYTRRQREEIERLHESVRRGETSVADLTSRMNAYTRESRRFTSASRKFERGFDKVVDVLEDLLGIEDQLTRFAWRGITSGIKLIFSSLIKVGRFWKKAEPFTTLRNLGRRSEVRVIRRNIEGIGESLERDVGRSGLADSLRDEIRTVRTTINSQLRSLVNETKRKILGTSGLVGIVQSAIPRINAALDDVIQKTRRFEEQLALSMQGVVPVVQDTFLRSRAEMDRFGSFFKGYVKDTISSRANQFQKIISSKVGGAFKGIESSAKQSFSKILESKEVFVSKLVKNFRDLSGRIEPHVVRISRVTANEFKKMSRRVGNIFDELKNKVDRTSKESNKAIVKEFTGSLRAMTRISEKIAPTLFNDYVRKEISLRADQFGKIISSKVGRSFEDVEVSAKRSFSKILESKESFVSNLIRNFRDLAVRIEPHVSRISRTTIDEFQKMSSRVGRIFEELGDKIGRASRESNEAMARGFASGSRALTRVSKKVIPTLDEVAQAIKRATGQNPLPVMLGTIIRNIAMLGRAATTTAARGARAAKVVSAVTRGKRAVKVPRVARRAVTAKPAAPRMFEFLKERAKEKIRERLEEKSIEALEKMRTRIFKKARRVGRVSLEEETERRGGKRAFSEDAAMIVQAIQSMSSVMRGKLGRVEKSLARPRRGRIEGELHVDSDELKRAMGGSVKMETGRKGLVR